MSCSDEAALKQFVVDNTREGAPVDRETLGVLATELFSTTHPDTPVDERPHFDRLWGKERGEWAYRSGNRTLTGHSTEYDVLRDNAWRSAFAEGCSDPFA